ncbi:RluA family pseudouridine synthase [Gemmata sp. G18]|uniref:Pseudouridine synthase n=1 Tax=Gemmata palustris TaxID=2822762 RepID=A0ABS5C322_9BACT|nr:RluA family pseudouridine synthase [Gemmata palustris]MBP3960391.1 RluA family pseudouridine synthase [Gemmata palustris]
MQQLPSPASEVQLLDWLLTALAPMNRTRVKQVLRSGRVTVNGASVTRHDHPLRPGDKVGIERDAPAPASNLAGITIVHEDAYLIVIDKPSGLLTVATESEKTDTAFVRLSAHLAARNAGRPFVVHRLDRDTSGLLLFARSAEVRDQLQASWEDVTKTYLAVVEGVPNPAQGTIENFLTEGRDLRVRAGRTPGKDAKRAVTRYKLRSSRGGHSLVEVELETGRKHQIRVHMAGLGCPVAGDKMYGATTDPVRRLCLHAWRLAFDHPFSGERVETESPIAPEVVRIVN